MENIKIAYVFPGQGSQYIGMGKDIYDAFQEAKTIFDQAEKILGIEIKKFCFEGPIEILSRTDVSQPAIFTASIACLEVLKRIKKDYIVISSLGLSLGEYTALVAAEAINFQDGLRLVQKRGQIMQQEADRNPGKMASVLGIDVENLEKVCQATNVEIANLNCPGQIVISGRSEDIEKAKEVAVSMGARRVIPLQVSGAFHSSYMKNASVLLKQELDKIKILDSKIEVISNVTAKPEKDANEIKSNLITQMYSRTKFQDSILYLSGKGIKNFYEIGPGKVLKGLISKIDSTCVVTNFDKTSDFIV